MLIEEKYCCGCGLCSHFVNGEINENGFYRPKDKQFKEKFDYSVCYCEQLKNVVTKDFWGNLKSAYYGYSKNPEIRKTASSGGILTELACYLLDQHIVDIVVQIRASLTDPLKTEVIWNTSSKDVIKCCGSRYTASSVLYGLLDDIDFNKKYAVIGKPCDIRVLRTYMNKSERMQKSIKYLLSFFCAGTPSQQANDNLLKHMKLNRNELSSFTYRGNGWPGKTVGYQKDGKMCQVDYEESWGNYLGRDIQDICRFCWEGTGDAADISCGDGWYLNNGKPLFKESDGRNIILTRTNKGEHLLKVVENANRISTEKIEDISVLNQMQPGQFMRKSAMFYMVLAMKIMRKSVPKYRLNMLYKHSKELPFKRNVQMFGGVIKRIIKGKIN